MTRRELLDKLDALRSAVEKLPEDVDVLGVNIDPDYLGGTVIALNDYCAPDIADIACAVGMPVETGGFGRGKERYFILGGVKVSQLVREEQKGG